MTVPSEKTVDGMATKEKGPSKGKMESFREFMYNSKEGTVMGRTGISWLQIISFYIIFYGFLAGFFSVVMILFLQTLDTNHPTRQLHYSKIGDAPGMGFRPHPMDFDSSLIWVKSGDDAAVAKSRKGYVDSLNEYFKKYRDNYQKETNTSLLPSEERPMYVNCAAQNFNKSDSTICRVDLDSFGPCGQQNDYGYNTSQPCVLLKLNRIINWEPQTYDLSNEKETPTELKKWLEMHHNGSSVAQNLTDQIYVTCEGEDLVDQEHIGPIALYPSSISKHFFPYTNQKFYLSPVVMVRFSGLDRGVMIDVVCQAWAKNIKRNVNEQLGAVRFSVLVDKPKSN